MKKRKILITMLILTLILTLSIGLTSCNDENKNDTTVKTLDSISVVGKSEYYVEDFNFNEAFNVQMKYSDGTTKTIPLVVEMLQNKNDYDDLRFMRDKENTGAVEKHFTIRHLGLEADYSFIMKHNPEITKEFEGASMLAEKTIPYGKYVAGQPIFSVENIPTLPNGEKAKVRYNRNNVTNVVGDYEVIAQVYAPGYKTLEFISVLHIVKKQIKKPEFIVTKDNPNPGELEYSTKYQYVPIERKSYDYTVSGEIRGKDSGKYVAKLDLTDPVNCAWEKEKESDEFNSDTIDIEWEITPKKIDLSTVEWNKGAGWTSSNFYLYSENPVMKYKVSTTKVPEVIEVIYEEDLKNNVIREQQSNVVGDYVTKVSFKVKESKKANYVIDTTKEIISELHWSIKRNRLDPEGIIKFTKTEFVFDGNPHMPMLSDVVKGADMVPSVEEGFRDAGTYPYSVSFYKEGFEPLTLETTCVINPKYIDIPRIINSSLQYNGEMQEVGIIGAGEGVVVKGNRFGKEPISNQLTFMLENPKNYRWKNVSKEEETKPISNQYTIWEITKIKLPSEYLEWKQVDGEKYVYDGTIKSIELDTKGVEGLKIIYEGNDKKDAGTYEVTAKVDILFNKDFYDGYEGLKKEYVGAQKGTLTIAPKKVDITGATWSKSQFIYKEKLEDLEYSVILTGLPKDIPEDLITYINDETYCNNVKLYDENGKPVEKEKILYSNQIKNYRTAKVVFNPNYDIGEFKETEIKWEIKEKPIEGIVYENTSFIYSPDGIAPVEPKGLVNKDAKVHYYRVFGSDDNPIYIEGKEYVIKNVGTYKQKVIIEKEGYSCFEQEITVEIVPKKINIPQVSSDKVQVTFNGKVQNCGILTNNEVYQIIGENSAMLAGKYPITIRLRPVMDEKGKTVYNYVWANNTQGGELADIKAQWEITPLAIDSSVLDNFDYKSNMFYNGKDQVVLLNGLPEGIVAEYKIIRTDGKETYGKAINAGVYTTHVTYSTVFTKEEDKKYEAQCYTNLEALKGDHKSVEWEIKPQEIDASGIRWRINEDKMPAIYYENYMGIAQEHKIELYISSPAIRETIKDWFDYNGVFTATQASATAYHVEATFESPHNNYILVNNASFQDNTFKTDWYITKNDLTWLEFIDDDPIKDGIQQTRSLKIDMEQEKLTLLAQKPEYTILDPTKEALKDTIDGGQDPNNIITFEEKDDEGNAIFTKDAVAGAGVYTYRVIINIKGYGIKDFLITYTINRMAIDRPTLDPGKPYNNPYELNPGEIKEFIISISHPAVPTQIKKPEWAYNVVGDRASAPGKYILTVELNNDNFVWKPDDTKPNPDTNPSTDIIKLLDWEVIQK